MRPRQSLPDTPLDAITLALGTVPRHLIPRLLKALQWRFRSDTGWGMEVYCGDGRCKRAMWIPGTLACRFDGRTSWLGKILRAHPSVSTTLDPEFAMVHQIEQILAQGVSPLLTLSDLAEIPAPNVVPFTPGRGREG